MKKTIVLFISAMVLAGFTFPAFNCSDLIFFKEGTRVTMTSYNKDGKETGSVKTLYTQVIKQADGASVSAQQEVFDKKGKSSSKAEYTITCQKGVLFFDMKTMLPQEQAESFKDFEMTVEGIEKELPADLKVGASLKDANVKFKLRTKEGTDMAMMNTTVYITNRKVEAFEKVTTAAGTFDCYKITEDVELKSIVKIRMKSITWFSLSAGTVKTESYKENGKFTGKTELTEIGK
jgi:hypothetical protein